VNFVVDDIKSLTIIDPPDMPIGPLKVSDVTAKSAELSWKPPKDDGGKPIKRYVIEQRDLKRNNWYQVDTVRPNTHTLTLDRLNEGNDYMFRIIAENDEGRSLLGLENNYNWCQTNTWSRE
jgi:titin